MQYAAIQPLPAALAARRDSLSDYAFGFAFVSSAALLLSIAVAHTCLVMALLLLAFSKTRLRFPPIIWPVAFFLAWTLASLAASDDPAAGLPQVKKFFVFATLPVVFSLFPRLDQARRLSEAWFVCALAASLVSVVQFLQKFAVARAAGEDFYDAYVERRITGFFSHWMTFSEVGLLVFLLLLSYLFFSASGRRWGRGVWIACGIVCGFALVLSFTRSVWLALAAGGAYLLWHWKPRLLLVAPVLAIVLVLLAPGMVRHRLATIASPDDNSARLIMWRTGARMIAQHPWLGMGPERVGPHFREFLPPDIARLKDLPPAYYSHLHNVYVHYAAERGLPAVAILLWLLLKVVLDHRRALQRLPRGSSDEKFLLQGVIAATIAVALVSCFDVSLGDSEILGLYLTLLALGYRAVERVNLLPGNAATV
jgi:O-antigen ligase